MVTVGRTWLRPNLTQNNVDGGLGNHYDSNLGFIVMHMSRADQPVKAIVSQISTNNHFLGE